MTSDRVVRCPKCHGQAVVWEPDRRRCSVCRGLALLTVDNHRVGYTPGLRLRRS